MNISGSPMNSSSFEKDVKGKFADMIRDSAEAMARELDSDLQVGWWEILDTTDGDISEKYDDESRLRVFTIYFLQQLSRQSKDDVVLDPEAFKAAMNAKEKLREAYPDETSGMPQNSIEQLVKDLKND